MGIYEEKDGRTDGRNEEKSILATFRCERAREVIILRILRPIAFQPEAKSLFPGNLCPISEMENTISSANARTNMNK
jgi:hypothetical protein